ncbi:hypothetical protein [Geminicoccus harenae]|uniref:hypothetical protein n=1 Tax=Geminicoccus harenae TaxID=2498453 RepID=UPI00168AD5F7|nr:hypothetical protein [Geminicoccus harenae]
MTHYLLEFPVILRDGVGVSKVVGPEGILFTTQVAIRPDQRIGGSFGLEPEADGATLQVDFQAVVQEVRALPEPGLVMVHARFEHLALVAQPPPSASLAH